jgi:DNA-binding MarR family transcriptional regulator
VQHNQLADDVWHDLSRFVLDNKDRWRKAVVEQTGLPFSRIRILSRLGRQSLTVKEVAGVATVDAPAATVAVNDLEARGLVVREVDPDNRRSKVVSLTDAGRRMVEIIDATKDPAPEKLCALDDVDLKALQEILSRLRG